MKLEIDKKYIITLDIGGKILTYTGLITDVDEVFISFTDKFDKDFSYNKNNIVSYEEVK